VEELCEEIMESCGLVVLQKKIGVCSPAVAKLWGVFERLRYI
jgi:hypothetical protein